jgi:hypothetical protein
MTMTMTMTMTMPEDCPRCRSKAGRTIAAFGGARGHVVSNLIHGQRARMPVQNLHGYLILAALPGEIT